MKTMKINNNLELKLNDGSQDYNVIIDNLSKGVVKFNSKFEEITHDEIQKIVDKLICLDMITLFGDKNGVTEVGIEIWEIEKNSGLYIETYHRNPDLPDNELFDDYDRTMEYIEFLNQ